MRYSTYSYNLSTLLCNSKSIDSISYSSIVNCDCLLIHILLYNEVELFLYNNNCDDNNITGNDNSDNQGRSYKDINTDGIDR